MDMSLISGIATALTTAVDMSRAAAGMRDSALIAAEVARINDQLLHAQQGLLRHNAELLLLTQQHFEATQQLREAQEALKERGRYEFVMLEEGQPAYRMKSAPDVSRAAGAAAPGPSEPIHYVCQPCFDKGIKAVLVGQDVWSVWTWRCPHCGDTRTGGRLQHG